MILATITWPTASQLIASGVINGAAYGLLGVGFAVILGVTGRFHFAYGFTYAVAAYGVYWMADRVHAPFLVAAVFGVLVCVAAGVLTERGIYRPLTNRAGASALLTIFVASLGLGIAGQNLISLFFSSAAQQVSQPISLRTPIHWGPVVFRWIDVWQVLSSAVLVVAFAAVLRFTGLGRAIKATRGNPEMARIIGINPNTIYLVCFAVGSFMCGVAALWSGVKFSVTPDMGFNPVIFSFVVAFLAGTASGPVRIFLTGVAVSLVQQLSSLFVETRWTQLVVFVILALYLVSLSIDPRKIWARISAAPAPTMAKV